MLTPSKLAALQQQHHSQYASTSNPPLLERYLNDCSRFFPRPLEATPKQTIAKPTKSKRQLQMKTKERLPALSPSSRRKPLSLLAPKRTTLSKSPNAAKLEQKQKILLHSATSKSTSNQFFSPLLKFPESNRKNIGQVKERAATTKKDAPISDEGSVDEDNGYFFAGKYPKDSSVSVPDRPLPQQPESINIISLKAKRILPYMAIEMPPLSDSKKRARWLVSDQETEDESTSSILPSKKKAVASSKNPTTIAKRKHGVQTAMMKQRTLDTFLKKKPPPNNEESTKQKKGNNDRSRKHQKSEASSPSNSIHESSSQSSIDTSEPAKKKRHAKEQKPRTKDRVMKKANGGKNINAVEPISKPTRIGVKDPATRAMMIKPKSNSIQQKQQGIFRNAKQSMSPNSNIQPRNRASMGLVPPQSPMRPRVNAIAPETEYLLHMMGSEIDGKRKEMESRSLELADENHWILARSDTCDFDDQENTHYQYRNESADSINSEPSEGGRKYETVQDENYSRVSYFDSEEILNTHRDEDKDQNWTNWNAADGLVFDPEYASEGPKFNSQTLPEKEQNQWIASAYRDSNCSEDGVGENSYYDNGFLYENQQSVTFEAEELSQCNTEIDENLPNLRLEIGSRMADIHGNLSPLKGNHLFAQLDPRKWTYDAAVDFEAIQDNEILQPSEECDSFDSERNQAQELHYRPKPAVVKSRFF
ncbi:hypothetical protein BDR26DRAFT_876417 [Obelidium mucronatum]|nr:hypothetical protein BDR26DRAFT_876417 [Obelidium mucronatum]